MIWEGGAFTGSRSSQTPVSLYLTSLSFEILACPFVCVNPFCFLWTSSSPTSCMTTDMIFNWSGNNWLKSHFLIKMSSHCSMFVLGGKFCHFYVPLSILLSFPRTLRVFSSFALKKFLFTGNFDVLAICLNLMYHILTIYRPA